MSDTAAIEWHAPFGWCLVAKLLRPAYPALELLDVRMRIERVEVKKQNGIRIKKWAAVKYDCSFKIYTHTRTRVKILINHFFCLGEELEVTNFPYCIQDS